jgi:hypothetical protein
MGKRDFEMTETITIHRPPGEFSATYEAQGVSNLISNRFTETAEDKTRWVLDSEFKFSSLLMKLMALFFPGMFRKQTLAFMQRFKTFAEKFAREGS